MDRQALSSPPTIVQVGEGARVAGPKHGGITKRDRAIWADGETTGEESTVLGRLVVLELVVVCDVPSATNAIGQNAILQGDSEIASRLVALRDVGVGDVDRAGMAIVDLDSEALDSLRALRSAHYSLLRNLIDTSATEDATRRCRFLGCDHSSDLRH